MIPVIIMGGILTGWFTPTEAGMAAAAYILLVLIPVLNPRHIRHLPATSCTPACCTPCPLRRGRRLGLRLDAGLLARARHGGRVHQLLRRHRPGMIMLLLVILFMILGDFIDAIPAIIIFMPIINKLTQIGDINPVHMGVVIITTLVFGLITPPYGLSLLIASKFIGVRFDRAMFASLPLYVVFFITIAFTCCFPTWCCGCRSSSCRNRSAVSRTPAAPAVSARPDAQRWATGRIRGPAPWRAASRQSALASRCAPWTTTRSSTRCGAAHRSWRRPAASPSRRQGRRSLRPAGRPGYRKVADRHQPVADRQAALGDIGRALDMLGRHRVFAAAGISTAT